MIETIHFKKASSEHTDAVFAAVRQVLKSAKSIEHIVVATTGGETGTAAERSGYRHGHPGRTEGGSSGFGTGGCAR